MKFADFSFPESKKASSFLEAFLLVADSGFEIASSRGGYEPGYLFFKICSFAYCLPLPDFKNFFRFNSADLELKNSTRTTSQGRYFLAQPFFFQVRCDL